MKVYVEITSELGHWREKSLGKGTIGPQCSETQQN